MLVKLAREKAYKSFFFKNLFSTAAQPIKKAHIKFYEAPLEKSSALAGIAIVCANNDLICGSNLVHLDRYNREKNQTSLMIGTLVVAVNPGDVQ